MGNCCPIFRRNLKQDQPIQNCPPPSTQRSFKDNTIKKQLYLGCNLNYLHAQQQRSQQFYTNLKPNTPSFHKISTKGLSTGIESCYGLQKSFGSSLNIATNFNIASMIIISTNNSFPSTSFQKQDYYILIDGISYVRKTNQLHEIQTPAETISIKCQQSNIMNTIFLARGIPLDQISMVSNNKTIQVQKSPIKINMSLLCRYCDTQIKLSYCIGVIQIDQIICEQCQEYGNWSLKTIISNYPLWGNGGKIQQGKFIQKAPSFIRALGCIHCFRFTQCQQLNCKCLICFPCKQQKMEKPGISQCKFCQGE